MITTYPLFIIRYLKHRFLTGFNRIGWKVGFGSGVTIRQAANISIGNSVYLDNYVVLQAPNKFEKTSKHSSVKLKIEDKVTVGLCTMISAVKKIHIQKNVLISQHCFIGDHNHEYKDITTPIRFQGLTNIKPIIIKEGAWIGANCTICTGVTIGKNSVVGANSVVTKSIPDFSVSVGTPAKVIKRFNKKTEAWEKYDQ